MHSPTVGNTVLTKGTLYVRTHAEKFSKSPPSRKDHLKLPGDIPGIPASYPCNFSFGLPRGMVRGGSRPLDKGWGGGLVIQTLR